MGLHYLMVSDTYRQMLSQTLKHLILCLTCNQLMVTMNHVRSISYETSSKTS